MRQLLLIAVGVPAVSLHSHGVDNRLSGLAVGHFPPGYESQTTAFFDVL